MSKKQIVTKHQPNQTIGKRYRLLSIAGSGGMATVWKAELSGVGRFKRLVAIKQMHEHLANQEIYVNMFCEEARIGGELQDPNIAQVYDFLSENNQYYLIMEWVDGTDLGSIIHYYRNHDQKIPWEIAAAVGIGMLRALTSAHERHGPEGHVEPIVHRDISPHNILVKNEGTAKLIDFGLSLTQDRQGVFTEPGIVKGKMSYLSPEIVHGEAATPSADIFAVGAVLWETLVGHRLFHGDNDLEVYAKLRQCQVQPLKSLRKDIPKELGAAIHKALAPEAQNRPPSASVMANELSRVLRHSRGNYNPRALLSQIVTDTCNHLDATQNVQASKNTSSVTNILDLDTQAPEKERAQNKGNLLHRLPFFGRSKR